MDQKQGKVLKRTNHPDPPILAFFGLRKPLLFWGFPLKGQGFGLGNTKILSVNSPALILSKNSGVFLAKIGSKSAQNRLKIG